MKREAVFGLALLVLIIVPVVAQQPPATDPGNPFDPAKRAAAVKRSQNQQLDVKQRIEAAHRLVLPNQSETKILTRIATDTDEPEALRRACVLTLTKDDNTIRLALGMLRDPKSGTAKFHVQLIDFIRTFRLKPGLPVYNDMIVTLRSLLDDARMPVRIEAFLTLAPLSDPVAIDLVIKGLRDPDQARIPALQSLWALNRAGAVNYLPNLRPFLMHKDPRVQMAAVGGLCADPQSRAQIVNIILDPEAHLDVRAVALRGLRSIDPEFISYCRKVIEDAQAPTRLRAEAVNTFIQSMNNHRVSKKEQLWFWQTIKRFADAKTEADNPLTKIAREIQPVLPKRFPVIGEREARIRRQSEIDEANALLAKHRETFRDRQRPVKARQEAMNFLIYSDVAFTDVAIAAVKDQEEQQAWRRGVFRGLVLHFNTVQTNEARQLAFAGLLQELLDAKSKETQLRAEAKRIQPWFVNRYEAVKLFFEKKELPSPSGE